MAAEAIAFFGCSRGEYLDVWNCARTNHYVTQHSRQTYTIVDDCCPDIGALVDQDDEAADYLREPYTDPATDDAWWYDSNRPESAGFYGIQITNVSGLYGNTLNVEQITTPGCDVSMRYQTTRTAQIITVEAVLHGNTCCANAYGLRALRHLLNGCGCESGCGGTTMRVLACIPGTGVGEDPNGDACLTPDDPFIPPEETVSPWRTLSNVKLIEEPSIIDGGTTGGGCGNCGCGKLTRIMFTLAADPGSYLDERELLAPVPIRDPNEPCEVLCDPECTESNFLVDPDCDPVILVPPIDALQGCFCPPLVVSRQCHEFDLSDRFFSTELEIEICAGSRALRNAEVRIWKKVGSLGYDTGIYDLCNMCAGFQVSYVPSGACFSRSVCGATVDTFSTSVNAGSVVGGKNGRGGDTCIRLECGTYIICIITDPDETAADATIAINGREFEP